jgi:hypothetical protein
LERCFVGSRERQPFSANTIATTVGGRKVTVLDEVRALVRDGLLVPTKGGFTVPR